MSIEAWEGDGLPDYPEDFIEALGFLPVEMDAMYEVCKREGWILERLAHYEDADRNKAMSAYFWRRAQRWKELATDMRARIDREKAE